MRVTFLAGAAFLTGAGLAGALKGHDRHALKLIVAAILLVGLGISKGGGFGIGWKTFFVLHGLVGGSAVLAGATLLALAPRLTWGTRRAGACHR